MQFPVDSTTLVLPCMVCVVWQAPQIVSQYKNFFEQNNHSTILISRNNQGVFASNLWYTCISHNQVMLTVITATPSPPVLSGMHTSSFTPKLTAVCAFCISVKVKYLDGTVVPFMCWCTNELTTTC